MHQFGTKVFPGIFIGYPLNSGRSWTCDLLIVDTEDLQTAPPSEIRVKNKSQEVKILQRNGDFVFPAKRTKSCKRDRRYLPLIYKA